MISQGGGGGVAYTDASPRIPVTAVSVADLCEKCSWAVKPSASGPVWYLKAVHSRCPEHRELSRGWSPPGAS